MRHFSQSSPQMAVNNSVAVKLSAMTILFMR